MQGLKIDSSVGSNVKIRLIGHCIICLKKLSTSSEEEATEKTEDQGYPEAVPKSLVSSEGFLATFQEIWGYLQNGSSELGSNSDINQNGRVSSFGISLEKVVAAGSQINVTFSRTPTPTICHQCFSKILAVENMMKVVRHQVRDIERLVRESRKDGKFGGRAEKIQKTLQVFTLEVDGGTDGDGHLDMDQDNENDNLENNVVEERPKRKRGRPPKPVISETSMDSTDQDQDDSSMDHDQEEKNPKYSEDKEEDPDFEVKTEPQEYSDDEGSNFSDEFLAAGSSAKSLRNSGRSSTKTDNTPKDSSSSTFQYGPFQRIRWQKIELSEEEIQRNWRVQCTTSQKNGTIVQYYCAHGKNCRVRVKIKTLKNGAVTMTTNGREHTNHRDKNFGLTLEQKQFVEECLKLGVNRPNNIMVSFRAKGIPAPRKKQLCCWLDRVRRREKEKNKAGKVQERTEGHKEQEDEVKT